MGWITIEHAPLWSFVFWKGICIKNKIWSIVACWIVQTTCVIFSIRYKSNLVNIWKKFEILSVTIRCSYRCKYKYVLNYVNDILVRSKDHCFASIFVSICETFMIKWPLVCVLAVYSCQYFDVAIMDHDLFYSIKPICH